MFDEGHMFDDGGRGATYELLVTHIRQNITSEQQLVLLSAVLPNSGDIAPKVVKEQASKEEAEEIKKKLEEVGAKVTLK